jgi:hypothetical protein
VDFAGVVARQATVTHHGIPMHAHQAAGFPHAATFGNVLQDAADLLLIQGRAKQGGSFPFGKSRLASSAAKHPPLITRPIVAAYGEVYSAPFSVIRALQILTTKPREIVHDRPSMP